MPEFPLASLDQLRSRAEVMGRPSPAPNSSGVYGWYFKPAPRGVDTTGCYDVGGWKLLYVGISPKEPPTNGRAPSRSTLRKRLLTHFAGNAAGSTLRKTLGCLLSDDLAIMLRRVGSGARYTLSNPGEQRLDKWMGDHARVVWLQTLEPWRVERDILASCIPLPLNVRDNPCVAHTEVLRGARAAAMRRADELPILVDSGGPRRLASLT
jgi:hypothetical protein